MSWQPELRLEVEWLFLSLQQQPWDDFQVRLGWWASRRLDVKAEASRDRDERLRLQLAERRICRACGKTYSVSRFRLKRSTVKACSIACACILGARNKLIVHNGESRTIREWSAQTGIPLYALRQRLKIGWPVARALGQPLREALGRKAAREWA